MRFLFGSDGVIVIFSDEDHRARSLLRLADLELLLAGSTPAQRATMRPPKFHELGAQHQWEIDRALGILDWSGS